MLGSLTRERRPFRGYTKYVKHLAFAGALFVAAFTPLAAPATLVDANYIPDGQYVVKVERVQDAKHVLVLMQNGVETNLVARGDVDFSKLKPNDTIKVAILKGQVPVFALQ